MCWYQPVPALSWSAVSAALVERRVLGYALAGAGVQLFRAEQKELRLDLNSFSYSRLDRLIPIEPLDLSKIRLYGALLATMQAI